MTHFPESSPQRSPLPNGLVAYCLLLLLGLAVPAAGQAPDRTSAVADFAKDPNGTVLGQIMKGAAVSFGAQMEGWQEVTVEGWVASNLVKNDGRDGFDVSVASNDGARIRTSPASDASVRMFARLGVLFDRLESRGSWMRVRRTAWIPVAAKEAAKPGPEIPTPAPKGIVQDSNSRPAQQALPDSGGITLLAGTPLATSPEGTSVGAIEVDRSVQILERRNGWTKIGMEVWVRNDGLDLESGPNGISAAAIRDNPDRYIGKTVEWRLQVLAVRKADELRSELPLGQPYVLARGPLPESGFVYLVINDDQIKEFESLEPLAEIGVRATVRAGKVRSLPTAVLNLVRRLD